MEDKEKRALALNIKQAIQGLFTIGTSLNRFSKGV
jgi:hypothetical protein